MNSKIFSTLLLGISLGLAPSAKAQDRSRDNRNDRNEHRHQPPSTRPYAQTPNNYRRRGEWRHGRVEQRDGHFRFAPKIRFRVRHNAHHFGPIQGLWEDLIRKGIGNSARAYRIGVTRLDNDQDYDVIDVNDTNNCVKKIRIRVEDADATIDRVALRYVDGSDQELDVNGYYAAGGGDTAWRDVPGWSKCIDSIVVIGQTEHKRNRRSEAQVEVWGLR